MSESVSLNRRKQGRFTKKVKNVKDKVKRGVIRIKEDVGKNREKPERGLVYVGHIPHGFYEEQMKEYFKQFGRVTNLRVCRSKKTGNSKGYGFVEFAHPGVAEIAADTMNNYLMFNRRLTAQYIPPEKQRRRLFKSRPWSTTSYPLKLSRKKDRDTKNKKVDDARCMARAKRQLQALEAKLKKLEALGIKHMVKPVDVPEEEVCLLTASASSEWEETYVQDPYKSDIEVRVKKQRTKAKKTIVETKPSAEESTGTTKTDEPSKKKKSLKSITKKKDKIQRNKDVNVKLGKNAKLLNLVKKEVLSNTITKNVKKLTKKVRNLQVEKGAKKSANKNNL